MRERGGGRESSIHAERFPSMVRYDVKVEVKLL